MALQHDYKFAFTSICTYVTDKTTLANWKDLSAQISVYPLHSYRVQTDLLIWLLFSTYYNPHYYNPQNKGLFIYD